jgi:glycosyltransferase involved in cell wall biosynthesis
MTAITDAPLVSICMLTYNHGDFIAQSIEGVINQKTDFEYKLFLGEDFSTDNTRMICIEFAKKYPEKINLYLNEKNDVKINAETINDLCFNSGAKYIAMCDGDDYWTDPLKLQKQVDFLEANPDYVICAHDVSVVKDNKLQYLSLAGPNSNDTFTIEDLAKGNLFTSLSVVYRNGLIERFPSWFYMSPIGDYVLHMLNARKGKIKFLPETMGVYRVHAGGGWSEQPTASQHEKMIVVLSFLLTEDFDENVKALLKIQKYHRTTDYLKAVLDSDSALFRAKLEELTIEYPQLGKEWLLNLFIDNYLELKEIREKYYKLKNSRLRKYLSNVFKQLKI